MGAYPLLVVPGGWVDDEAIEAGVKKVEVRAEGSPSGAVWTVCDGAPASAGFEGGGSWKAW